jgi:hypothetical protein
LCARTARSGRTADRAACVRSLRFGREVPVSTESAVSAPEPRKPYRLPYVGQLPRTIRQALDSVGGRGRNTLRAALMTVDAFCRHHKTDRVYINNGTIAAEIGVSRGHVSRVLDRLEAILLPGEGVPVLTELADPASPTGRWLVLPWFTPRPAPTEPVGERPPLRVRQRNGHYVCASATATTCAPGQTYSLKERAKGSLTSTADDAAALGGPTTSAKEEDNPDHRDTPEEKAKVAALLAEIKAKIQRDAAPAVEQQAAPVSPLPSLSKAVEGPKSHAMSRDEQLAALAARKRQRAAQTAPAAVPDPAPVTPAPAAAPRGWVAKLFRRS